MLVLDALASIDGKDSVGSHGLAGAQDADVVRAGERLAAAITLAQPAASYQLPSSQERVP